MNEGKEEKAKRRAGLIKRLGVLKWLEGEYMKDARTVGTLNNGTNSRKHNPLPHETLQPEASGGNSEAHLPDANSIDFIQLKDLQQPGSTMSSLIDDKTKQKLTSTPLARRAV